MGENSDRRTELFFVIFRVYQNQCLIGYISALDSVNTRQIRVTKLLKEKSYVLLGKYKFRAILLQDFFQFWSKISPRYSSDILLFNFIDF